MIKFCLPTILIFILLSCKPESKEHNFELKIFLCTSMEGPKIPSDIINFCYPIRNNKDSALQFTANGINDNSSSPLLARLDTSTQQSLHINTKDVLSNTFGGSKPITKETLQDHYSKVVFLKEFASPVDAIKIRFQIDSLIKSTIRNSEFCVIFNSEITHDNSYNIPIYSSLDSVRNAIEIFLSSNPKNKSVNIIYWPGAKEKVNFKVDKVIKDSGQRTPIIKIDKIRPNLQAPPIVPPVIKKSSKRLSNLEDVKDTVIQIKRKDIRKSNKD